MKKNSLIFLLTVLISCFLPSTLLAQVPPGLQAGIEQYRADDYERHLKHSRSSGRIPFLFGGRFLAGADLQADEPDSGGLQHLEAASTIKPSVKEAVIELIDALYQTGRIAEARKWIVVAEENSIYPAKTAFLKGMILAREGKHGEAIESFERSKKMDPSYKTAADFQIGVSLMLEKKFDKARDRFQAAITQDPLSRSCRIRPALFGHRGAAQLPRTAHPLHLRHDGPVRHKLHPGTERLPRHSCRPPDSSTWARSTAMRW